MSDRAQEIAALVDSGAAPNAEYAERMLGAQPSAPTDPQVAAEDAGRKARPEHVPEKFWDPERGQVRVDDVLKSYVELEKKLREGKPAEAAQEETQVEAERVTLERKKEGEQKAGEAESPLADVLSKAGISFDAVNTEYQQNGGNISDDTRAKLVAAFGEEVVDTYFQGLKALESAQLLSAYEAAGGKEVFDAAANWGLQALSDEELDTYNALVTNPKTQKQGVEWLVAKYRDANPSEGELIDTEGGGGPGDVFTSREEMTAAMRDPRYARDPSYRQQVAEKLARSRKAGTLSTGVEYFQR